MDYKYLRSVLKYVLTTVLSVGVALYIGYHLVNGFSSSVETTSANSVNQESTQTLDGYIMRSEELIYAGSDGSMNYLVKDGQKVGIHDSVAELYSGTESAEASAKLAEIDRRLDLLSNSNLSAGQTYSDTEVVDEYIGDLYYTILQKVNDGKCDFALQKKDNLLSYLNKRMIVTGQLQNFDDQIAALTSEREALVTASGNVLQTITSPASGFYYADVDGFEKTFSADKLDTMTLDDFEEMTKSEADMSLNISSTGGISAGKVVTEFNWYVCCEIDVKDIRNYNMSNNYTVIFPYNADKRIKMKLYDIIQENEDNRIVLVFQTKEIPENFNYLRRQTVEVVTDSTYGYRIPASAVRISNGKQGVYILKGYIVYFREIKPIMEVDNYIIASTTLDDANAVPLREYDAVITEGKNLYDGKVIS